MASTNGTSMDALFALVTETSADHFTPNASCADVITPHASLGDVIPAVERREAYETALTACVLGFIAVISLTGNVSLIAAVLTDSNLRGDQSSMFVINLGIVDLATTLVVMGTAFLTLVRDDVAVDAVWCNIACAANYLLIIVSMQTLCNVSVERYIAVKMSLRYNVMVTRMRIGAAIGYSWVEGFAFAVAPVLLGWVDYDYWEVICAIGWQKEKDKAVYYVITAFLVCFVLPGAAMTFCYAHIIAEAGKLKRIADQMTARGGHAITASGPAKVARSEQTRALKTITSLLVVVVSFFVFMTPFCVTKLLKVVVADPAFVPRYVNVFAALMQYIASMVNPFIYGLFRKEYRRAYSAVKRRYLAHVLGAGCHGNNNGPHVQVVSPTSGTRRFVSGYVSGGGDSTNLSHQQMKSRGSQSGSTNKKIMLSLDICIEEI